MTSTYKWVKLPNTFTQFYLKVLYIMLYHCSIWDEYLRYFSIKQELQGFLKNFPIIKQSQGNYLLSIAGLSYIVFYSPAITCCIFVIDILLLGIIDSLFVSYGDIAYSRC